jgi:hypothetical protein
MVLASVLSVTKASAEPQSTTILELPGRGSTHLERLPDEVRVMPETEQALHAGASELSITWTRLSGPVSGIRLPLRYPFYP